ncbi:hypothetical protein FHG87_001647 [Trinorchestia longiramus]|nr:hypothetical protein FHG87_001647 [Trinorchestia longiramus]
MIKNNGTTKRKTPSQALLYGLSCVTNQQKISINTTRQNRTARATSSLSPKLRLLESVDRPLVRLTTHSAAAVRAHKKKFIRAFAPPCIRETHQDDAICLLIRREMTLSLKQQMCPTFQALLILPVYEACRNVSHGDVSLQHCSESHGSTKNEHRDEASFHRPMNKQDTVSESNDEARFPLRLEARRRPVRCPANRHI